MIKLRHLRCKLSQTMMNFWLLYSVLVFALLVIIGVPLYYGFFCILSNEANKTTTDILTRLNDTMDARMKELDRISLQISQNPDFIPFFMKQEGPYSVAAVNDLIRVRDTNDFIDDIAIYYTPESMDNDSGMMYSASGACTPETFFNCYYRYDKWDVNQLKTDTRNLLFPKMRPLENVQVDNSNKEEYMTYICPIIPGIKQNTRGVLLFLISKQRIDEMIGNSIIGTNGLICIYDAGGSPVYCMNHTGIRTVEIPKTFVSDQTSGISGRDISKNGNSFFQMTKGSSYNRWSYLCLLPRGCLMQKVYANLNLILYTLMIALLLGLVLAYLLSVKSYVPIRQLKRKLVAQEEAQGGYDDFKLISRSVDSLIKSNVGLMTRLSSQQTLVRMQVLQRLFFRRYHSEAEMEKLLMASEVELPFGYYNVMVFSIDNYRRFSTENGSSVQEMLRFGILNVMEELSQRSGCKGYGVDLPGDHIMALLLNHDVLKKNESLYETIGQNMIDFFKLNFSLTFTIGLGETCDTIDNIPECFAQSAAAVNERFVRGKERLIYYHELRRVPQPVYPYDDEKCLLEALRQGNALAMEKSVNDIVKHLLTGGSTADNARAILSSEANAVNQLLENMVVSLDGDIKSVMGCGQDTIGEWQAEMNNIALEATRKVLSIKESNNLMLKEQLMDWINLHYSDSEISLQSLAGKFGLSMGYITRFFKDQTGVSLMHYLDQVRMGYAEQLIGNSVLPLRDIIYQCGYFNETNFIRKFRAVYGQTPIQYRRSIQLRRNHQNDGDNSTGVESTADYNN